VIGDETNDGVRSNIGEPPLFPDIQSLKGINLLVIEDVVSMRWLYTRGAFSEWSHSFDQVPELKPIPLFEDQHLLSYPKFHDEKHILSRQLET
jgi:hypothetical protein